MEKYDSNGDGTLDIAEREVVREAALAEAEQEKKTDTLSLPEHRVARPKDKALPYLISSRGHEQLSRKFRIHAVLYAMGFLAAGALFTRMLTLI